MGRWAGRRMEGWQPASRTSQDAKCRAQKAKVKGPAVLPFAFCVLPFDLFFLFTAYSWSRIPARVPAYSGENRRVDGCVQIE